MACRFQLVAKRERIMAWGFRCFGSGVIREPQWTPGGVLPVCLMEQPRRRAGRDGHHSPGGIAWAGRIPPERGRGYNDGMIAQPTGSAGPSITFLGAAQTVTGSMHLVEAGGERILLDCGSARLGKRGPRAE